MKNAAKMIIVIVLLSISSMVFAKDVSLDKIEYFMDSFKSKSLSEKESVAEKDKIAEMIFEIQDKEVREDLLNKLSDLQKDPVAVATEEEELSLANIFLISIGILSITCGIVFLFVDYPVTIPFLLIIFLGLMVYGLFYSPIR